MALTEQTRQAATGRVEAPAFDAEAYRWWAAGATAEARARREGCVDGDAREFLDFVEVMAGHGYDRDAMIRNVAHVYGPGLPWPERWRAAWHVLRGYRRPRLWSVKPELCWDRVGVSLAFDRDDTSTSALILVGSLLFTVRRFRRGKG